MVATNELTIIRADIVGVVVHVGDLEHQQSFPRRIANREYTLVDTRYFYFHRSTVCYKSINISTKIGA